jgi:glycine/sarcosine N-methyltransferase
MAEETPVDFYDALAPMFDVMTDWEARLAAEGPFLRAELEGAGARRVLDAACGSGGHALALTSWGFEAAGADVSRGMIELARHKVAERRLEVPFTVTGLDDLSAHYPAGAFDAVLCLGNSLPHLLTQAALVAALDGIAGVLRPGGLVITQALNYDLRWVKQPRFFAAQGGSFEGQEVLVWRFADYDVPAGRILFNLALFRKAAAGWNVQVHTTPHRPIMQDDMLAGLAAAGFRDPRSYGMMAWPAPPFDPDASGDLVMVARFAGQG